VLGFDEDDIHEAFSRSDYVVLACPLNDLTRGLVGEDELATLPPNAVVVNAARGGIIDTDALVSALQFEGIRGAALDVTDPEPLPADHPLWDLENCLITPHGRSHAETLGPTGRHRRGQRRRARDRRRPRKRRLSARLERSVRWQLITRVPRPTTATRPRPRTRALSGRSRIRERTIPQRIPRAEYDYVGGDIDRPELVSALEERIDGEVRFDEYSRRLYATDASAYEVTPVGVVLPRSTDDVAAVVDYCADNGIPVLPRGGGTSLAGQAVKKAVVLDLTTHMDGLRELSADDRHATVQAGTVLADLNGALEPTT